MIKFFRRIRQKLVTEGKLSKYLVYAFGEIILVVIGILIALSINNWNERNKNEIYVETLLSTIESNLIKEIKSTNARMHYYFQKDSLTNLVLTDALNKNDYINNPELGFLIYRSEGPIYLPESIKTLLDKEEELPSQHTPIINIAKDIEKRISSFDETYKHLNDVNIQENFEFLANHIPTYIKRDSVTTATKIDFYLKSESYKSKVSRNWSITNRLARQVAHLRLLSIKMLINIKSRKKSMSSSEIKELLESFDFLPFHEVSCQDNATSSERNREEPYLVINLSETTVNLHNAFIDNPDNYIFTREVAPFEIRHIPQTYRGIDGEYAQIVTQHDPNKSECMKKYVSRKNGYIIIE